MSDITHLPFFQQYDPLTKQLTLRGATFFPEDIFQFADDIEILDMAHGQLTRLPDDFGRLHKLRIAFFSSNPFTELPSVLRECTSLEMVGFKSCQLERFPEQALPPTVRWLTLTDNRLRQLPNSIGQLTNLQKCLVTGNRLQQLPDSLQACRQLGLLRLAANDLTAPPPDWLFALPRLAWYGDAGNPFIRRLSSATSDITSTTSDPSLPVIAWDQLTLGPTLGESPSSTVYEIIVRGSTQPLALKLYKNSLNSDGLPADDRRACLAAGSQPNLIAVRGRLIDHPQQQSGIILDLVPLQFTGLGLPPSFLSCTRDTFTPGVNFTPSFIWRVVQQTVAALAHLHQRGIQHGDVYAHNMLVDSVGTTFLGDFGAATIYNRTTEPQRELLDVCALGYLIDDLLLHCSAAADCAQLIKLRTQCLQPAVHERPRFAEITDWLSGFAQ